MANPALATATGRRKTSIARVRLLPGTGAITVNGRDAAQYFPRPAHQLVVNQPLDATKNLGRYDIAATITGGGK